MVSNIGFDVGMTQIREEVAKLLQKYCFGNILVANMLIYPSPRAMEKWVKWDENSK